MILVTLLSFVLGLSQANDVSWSEAISSSLNRNYDSLEYRKLSQIGDTNQFSAEQFYFDIPWGRDDDSIYNFCQSLPHMDSHLCHLCTEVMQHNQLLKLSRTYDINTIEHHTFLQAKDLSMKYLLFAYDGIRQADYFPSKSYCICLFGEYSLQILYGIAGIHNHDASIRIKYFIYVSPDTFSDNSTQIIRDKYEELWKIRNDYQNIQFQFFIIEDMNKIDTTQLTSCNVLHWREIPLITTEKQLKNNDIPLAEYEAMVKIVSHFDSFHHHSQQHGRIPIIYEHRNLSHTIHWTLNATKLQQLQLQQQEKLKSETVADGKHEWYLQWLTVGKGYDGIYSPVVMASKGSSCGNLIFSMHVYDHMRSNSMDILIGELSATPLPFHSSHLSTTNKHHHHEDHHWCNNYFFFITYDVNFYLETAHGLTIAFQQIGCSQIVIMGLFDYAKYLSYLQQYSLSFVIQIALGPHRPSMLSRQYIVYHTENTWDSFLEGEKYTSLLHEAMGIFVYSTANVPYIHSLLGSKQKKNVFILPLMYTLPTYYTTKLIPVDEDEKKGSRRMTVETYERNKTYERSGMLVDREFQTYHQSLYSFLIHPSHNNHTDMMMMNTTEYLLPVTSLSSASYDLSLIGSPSERRNQIVQDHILSQAQTDRYTLFISHSFPTIDLFDVYTREFFIVHSKIILNFHQFEASILETHRINHLLSLGKVIVSERSYLDPLLDAFYEDAIVFVSSPEELYIQAKRLLENVSLLQAWEVKACQKYEQIMQNTSHLQSALQTLLTSHSLFL